MDAALVAPYLDVLDRAIEDRWLSPAEQSELTEVAMTLGLTSDRVRKLHSDYMTTLVALARRDGVVTDRERVVTRELAQELAEQAGMTVAPRVTKKLDVLVVANPNSLSGKARKAREYGTRIVAETAFWSMIGVEVS